MNWTVLIIAAIVIAAFLLAKRASFISESAAREHLRAGALVIDVRSPEEFQQGHIAGAINIPLGQINRELPIQVPDKNRVLLLHCLSGGRSAIAKQQARKLGYPNSFNLGSLRRAQQIVEQSANR
jgi:phage shock protein E